MRDGRISSVAHHKSRTGIAGVKAIRKRLSSVRGYWKPRGACPCAVRVIGLTIRVQELYDHPKEIQTWTETKPLKSWNYHLTCKETENRREKWERPTPCDHAARRIRVKNSELPVFAPEALESWRLWWGGHTLLDICPSDWAVHCDFGSTNAEVFFTRGEQSISRHLHDNQGSLNTQQVLWSKIYTLGFATRSQWFEDANK